MTGRRKRPLVPETSRKRVARACDACRHVKEKCEGGIPCTRCVRLDRDCGKDESPRSEKTSGSSVSEARSNLLDPERIRCMEAIITRYTGSTAFDKATLKQILEESGGIHEDSMIVPNGMNVPRSLTVADIEDDSITDIEPRQATKHPVDFSHCYFLDRVQKKIDEGLQDLPSKRQQWPVRMHDNYSSMKVARLASKDSIVSTAAASLPPIEVSRFLTDVFFQYAQTNHSYVEEATFRSKLEFIYLGLDTLSVHDSPPLCVILAVLAIGSQMAHLSSNASEENSSNRQEDKPDDVVSPDDNVALSLYRAATTLVSDVITIGSVESVQAVLLLGIYTLPVDAASLSYCYFGIAVRLAVSKNMHRRSAAGVDPRSIEQRNRIWWSVYTLERRISVLHGMPVSLSRAEVDAPLPTDRHDSHTERSNSNLPNILAMINLTAILERARDKMTSLRSTPIVAHERIIASVLRLKHDLLRYWQTLLDKKYCRDLEPSGAFFRNNVHLALTYHLIHIFMGRFFIFSGASPQTDNLGLSAEKESLASGCIDSALSIIDLCQLLKDETGLARASYTEFTTCRSALLVILARRIQKQDVNLRKASEKGMRLINFMSVGLYSSAAEKAGIEAMENAVRQLNEKASNGHTQRPPGSSSAYDQFRSWATLWRNDEDGHVAPSTFATGLGRRTISDGSRQSQWTAVSTSSSQGGQGGVFDSIFSSFPFELNEFASMSGLDQDFNFSTDGSGGIENMVNGLPDIRDLT